jgi:imidazolonepropionase
MKTLFGPFAQILTFATAPIKGALPEKDLEILSGGGILVSDERIELVGDFEEIAKKNPKAQVETMPKNSVALPGFIDCHTHLCWAGSRGADYSDRNNGVSYVEIAKRGGGIQDSVKKTRAARDETLVALMLERLQKLSAAGCTSVEVKSGYGLSLEEELRHLRAIRAAARQKNLDIVPTCLAAHVKPFDWNQSSQAYLEHLAHEVLPRVKQEGLAQRVDIYVDEGAFQVEEARTYLQAAKALGFDLTLHADQFRSGGSKLAVEVGALSADHLEASSDEELRYLAQSKVTATLLPGATLGLGQAFPPARKLLDLGACVAIASDWNPGSAPNGDLLAQTAFLQANQKLSNYEALAGITYRASQALGLIDRGRIAPHQLCDLAIFPCQDYRDILYHQGQLRPTHAVKRGRILYDVSEG